MIYYTVLITESSFALIASFSVLSCAASFSSLNFLFCQTANSPRETVLLYVSISPALHFASNSLSGAANENNK